MIRKKWDQPIRMRIEFVLPQYIGDAACGSAMQQDIANGEEHWEIENRRQPAVDAIPLFPAAHKKRSHSRVGMKNLADRCEVRIDATQSCMPLLPKSPRDVRKRVHAQAIKARRLDPPD